MKTLIQIKQAIQYGDIKRWCGILKSSSYLLPWSQAQPWLEQYMWQPDQGQVSEDNSATGRACSFLQHVNSCDLAEKRPEQALAQNTQCKAKKDRLPWSSSNLH